MTFCLLHSAAFTAVSWASCLVFSPLVGSLVASVLIRLIWSGGFLYTQGEYLVLEDTRREDLMRKLGMQKSSYVATVLPAFTWV